MESAYQETPSCFGYNRRSAPSIFILCLCCLLYNCVLGMGLYPPPLCFYMSESSAMCFSQTDVPLCSDENHDKSTTSIRFGHSWHLHPWHAPSLSPFFVPFPYKIYRVTFTRAASGRQPAAAEPPCNIYIVDYRYCTYTGIVSYRIVVTLKSYPAQPNSVPPMLSS